MRKSYLALALSAGALAATPVAASAATKVVYAGGPVKWASSLQKRYGAGVNNYLINKVTIDAGGSVVWNGASLASGFHTVDIPKVGGTAQPLITSTGNTVQNDNDAAGKPFWFNGKVPVLSFNTQLFSASGGHTYNGTTRVDSGLPLGPKPHDFKVTFTTPGTYKFFCDVHPGMIGYVVVRAKGTPVPNAKRDANELRAEEQHYTAEAKRVDREKPRGNNVSLGESGPGGLEVFAMFPRTLTVQAGTTVRFSMSKFSRETHTASFGPPSYLTKLSDTFQSPAPAPEAVYPSDPPGQIVLTSTSHGNGFAGTGALDNNANTPLPKSQTIKFSQPGTYHFICLIHEFMHGTIIVK